MRFSFLLCVAIVYEAAAFQVHVKQITEQLSSGSTAASVTASASAAAFITLANPLVAQASETASTNPAAVVVNVEVPDLDAKAGAISVWQNRGQLQQAAIDFVDSVKKIGNDLDGVLPPPPGVGVVPPENIKKAARDALSGQARLDVNGNPVYFEVDSDEGFLTLRVLSPLLPKLPFLAPTEAQRETMVKPPPIPSTITKVETEVLERANGPFWERLYVVPVVGKTLTYAEVAVDTVVAVAGAYATSYLYYISQQNQGKKAATPEVAKKPLVKDPEKKIGAPKTAKKTEAKNGSKTTEKPKVPQIEAETDKQLIPAEKKPNTIDNKVEIDKAPELSKSVESKTDNQGKKGNAVKRFFRRIKKLLRRNR